MAVVIHESITVQSGTKTFAYFSPDLCAPLCRQQYSTVFIRLFWIEFAMTAKAEIDGDD